MYIISYNVKYKDLDSLMETLQINDIYNAFYENPLEITTDEYGYGYLEKETEDIILKVAFEGASADLNDFIKTVNTLIGSSEINVEENNYDYSVYDFPAIHLDDNWVICNPNDEIDTDDKKIINFISQGAFGTGLHETTQDILKLILNKLPLNDKTLLDIGTGSGILSIAASMAGAKSVVAVDIRDVKDEVELNSSLNNLDNIETVVGNILEDDTLVANSFDWIFINIGGEETKLFMDFITKHLNPNGKLLVSGLVEWSFDEVKAYVEKYGFTLSQKYQTNEWVTATFDLNCEIKL